jgi:hypothetical protein
MTKKREVKDLTHMPNKDHGFEIGLFTTERLSLACLACNGGLITKVCCTLMGYDLAYQI